MRLIIHDNETYMYDPEGIVTYMANILRVMKGIGFDKTKIDEFVSRAYEAAGIKEES